MSRMARVVVNKAEMDALLKSQTGAVARDLISRGRRVETRAKELVHVDTSRLRASIYSVLTELDGQLVEQIGSNVDYSIYLEARYPFLAPALEAAF